MGLWLRFPDETPASRLPLERTQALRTALQTSIRRFAAFFSTLCGRSTDKTPAVPMVDEHKPEDFAWVESVTNHLCNFVLHSGGWSAHVRAEIEALLLELVPALNYLSSSIPHGFIKHTTFSLHMLYLLTHIFFVQTNYLERVPTDLSTLLLFDLSVSVLHRILPAPCVALITQVWRLNMEALLECMILLEYAAIPPDAHQGQDYTSSCLACLRECSSASLKWNLRITIHVQTILALWSIAAVDVERRLSAMSSVVEATSMSDVETASVHSLVSIGKRKQPDGPISCRGNKKPTLRALEPAPPAAAAPAGSRAAPLPMHDSTADWRAGRYRELRQRLDDDGFLFVRGVIEEPVVLGAREKLVHQLAAKGLTLPGSDPMEALPAHAAVDGYTVDAETGYVYSTRQHENEPSGAKSWCSVGLSRAVREVYAGAGLRRFYQLLFQDDADYVARPEWGAAGISPYTLLTHCTWLRAKGPGQSTIPHADLKHFADNSTVLGDFMLSSADGSDASALNQLMVCNGCNQDDAHNTLICDICQRGYHPACLVPPMLPASVRKTDNCAEWQCHDCCELPVPYWTAWIPLGRIAEGDGRLMLLPRSHRGYGGYRSSQKDRELPAQFNAAAHKAAQWCAPTAGMEAGDLILFNLKTIHAATANGRSKLRLSMDTRVTTGKGRRFREDHGLSDAPAAAALPTQKPVAAPPPPCSPPPIPAPPPESVKVSNGPLEQLLRWFDLDQPVAHSPSSAGPLLSPPLITANDLSQELESARRFRDSIVTFMSVQSAQDLLCRDRLLLDLRQPSAGVCDALDDAVRQLIFSGRVLADLTEMQHLIPPSVMFTRACMYAAYHSGRALTLAEAVEAEAPQTDRESCELQLTRTWDSLQAPPAAPLVGVELNPGPTSSSSSSEAGLSAGLAAVNIGDGPRSLSDSQLQPASLQLRPGLAAAEALGVNLRDQYQLANQMLSAHLLQKEQALTSVRSELQHARAVSDSRKRKSNGGVAAAVICINIEQPGSEGRHRQSLGPWKFKASVPMALVRAMVTTEYEIPLMQQRLTFQGRLLDKFDWTLAEYDLPAECRLSLSEYRKDESDHDFVMDEAAAGDHQAAVPASAAAAPARSSARELEAADERPLKKSKRELQQQLPYDEDPFSAYNVHRRLMQPPTPRDPCLLYGYENDS